MDSEKHRRRLKNKKREQKKPRIEKFCNKTVQSISDYYEKDTNQKLPEKNLSLFSLQTLEHFIDRWNPFDDEKVDPQTVQPGTREVESDLFQPFEDLFKSLYPSSKKTQSSGGISGVWSWITDEISAVFGSTETAPANEDDETWFEKLTDFATDQLIYNVIQPTRDAKMWTFISKYATKTDTVNRILMKKIIGTGLLNNPPSPIVSINPDIPVENTTYYALNLPPLKEPLVAKIPISELMDKIFTRKNPDPYAAEPNNKSNIIFPWFAQWFIEQGFKTGIKHEPDLYYKENELERTWASGSIDLSQLYGPEVDPERTSVLRARDGTGKLRSQFIPPKNHPDVKSGKVKAEEFPIYWKELTEDEKLKCPLAFPKDNAGKDKLTEEEKGKFFVIGHPRQNLHPGVLIFTTLFLREHNRLCDVLKSNYPDWTEDQLFTWARKILLAKLLKMTVEDYIQHINAFKNIFDFKFRPELLPELRHPDDPNQGWEFKSRLCLEFNMIYRWHSLVPDTVVDEEGKAHSVTETFYDTQYVVDRGIGRILSAASKQPAHAFGAHSAPVAYLLSHGTPSLHELSILHCRKAKLQSFNAYRRRFDIDAVKTFAEINPDPEVIETLRKAYPPREGIDPAQAEAEAVNQVEFFVGLMCEQVRSGIFPPLLKKMVLSHSMKKIYSNPLCQPSSWNKENFLVLEGEKNIDVKGVAWNEVQKHNLANMISRNTKNDRVPIRVDQVSFQVVK